MVFLHRSRCFGPDVKCTNFYFNRIQMLTVLNFPQTVVTVVYGQTVVLSLRIINKKPLNLVNVSFGWLNS